MTELSSHPAPQGAGMNLRWTALLFLWPCNLYNTGNALEKVNSGEMRTLRLLPFYTKDLVLQGKLPAIS